MNLGRLHGLGLKFGYLGILIDDLGTQPLNLGAADSLSLGSYRRSDFKLL